MHSNQQITSFIEDAFKPLRCVAQNWDYGAKFRFRVYGTDGAPLLRMDTLTASVARSRPLLESLLAQARERVIQRGYQLDQWSLPTD